MSYNQKKFLDANGLTHFIKILDNYPTNEILDTVINAIQSSIDNVVIVSETQPTASDNKIWIKPSVQDTVQVPTVEEMNEAIAAVDVPVQDVQINGTSILSNGIANVPIGSAQQKGVFRIDDRFGIRVLNYASYDGVIAIKRATPAETKKGENENAPLTPSTQHLSTFYGLTKAAGVSMASSSNPVGTYTPEAKGAIQSMLGVSDLIATAENDLVASKAYAIGDVFTANGKLYKVTTAIAADGTIVLQNEGETVSGANAIETKVGEGFPHDVQVNGVSVVQDGVANVPMASDSRLGTVKIQSNYGIIINPYTGDITVAPASSTQAKSGAEVYKPITPVRQHESTFYGLAKAAGADEKDSTLPLGTYSDTAKSAIRTMIGAAASGDGSAAPVQDVQINSTSILSNGIANIPIATSSSVGVISGYGSTLFMSNGRLHVNSTGNMVQPIKQGIMENAFTPVSMGHAVTFYGLAKAAGDTTMASSSNAVGTYTDSAKTAIRSMLGATSSNVIAVQDTQPTDTDTKIWLPETAETPVQIPTMEDLGNYVQKTDYATANTAGLVQIGAGLRVSNAGLIWTDMSGSTEIKAGTSNYTLLSPNKQHESVFYGLAKASGDTTQAVSSNAVGTYTDEAKSAIRTMLGAGKVDDVQINGTSILSNGVANIPKASSTGTFGVVFTDVQYGLWIDGNGILRQGNTSSAVIKAGTDTFRAVHPNVQHESTFYGLTKAAGVDMSSSSNAVGVYTKEAKAAIQTMLGVEAGAAFIESNSDSNPVITGVANTRYVCGEVQSINITPPSNGIIDVIFTSGTSPAVLTLPNTVKFPEWFDAENLETNTIYEINITDGIYGAVMTWLA